MEMSSIFFSRKKKGQKKAEAELVFALRNFAAQLDAGLSFEECLKKEKVFEKITKETGMGASVPEALQKFSSEHESYFVKKSAALLADIYVKGGSAAPIKKLAEEQAAANRAKTGEYNEKLAMFSLVFVALSAVVPAFFQAFVIVGSSFMPLQIPPNMAFVIPVFIFPLLNAAAFAFIISKRP